MRSFFAIPLSIEAEQQLSQKVETIKQKMESEPAVSLRWISLQNYHITLAFLGNIQNRDVERLHRMSLDMLDEIRPEITRENLSIGLKPQLLSVSHVSWFPSNMKPHLLVLMIEKSQALVDLQKTICRKLRQSGFNLEKRDFIPHISLARMNSERKGCVVPNLDQVTLELKTPFDELVLFSSQQSSSGSIYTPLFAEPIDC